MKAEKMLFSRQHFQFGGNKNDTRVDLAVLVIKDRRSKPPGRQVGGAVASELDRGGGGFTSLPGLGTVWV